MCLQGTDDPVCAFCQRPKSDGARRFVSGPLVYICEWCIELCTDILEEERKDV